MTSILLPVLLAISVQGPPGVEQSRVAAIDLREGVIVSASARTIPVAATEMLQTEIRRRTRLGLDTKTELAGVAGVAILVGTLEELAGMSFRPPAGLEMPRKADAYALWIDRSRGQAATTVCVAGFDDRGSLFAAGRLLRLLEMSRDRISLDGETRLASAPRYSLRGHQLGYRPKTNSYDGWDLETWEQYLRDLIVFGTNAIELIPPRSDDDLDSPHFPEPPLPVMIGMSRLAAKYGLEVWIWYPAIDRDYSDPATLGRALQEREEVFSALPKIDALFVPSGDPGEVHPDTLFPLMRKQKEILNRYHPTATIWSSIQNYDDEPRTMGWTEAFYSKLRSGEADWLDGVVFGPATETTLPEMRRAVPDRFPIRRYPDITHSKNCQYPVPGWDSAFRNTLGREAINPRPRDHAEIFRNLQQYSFGFISYSEGCNDDVNKIVWSSLGWDPETPVNDILEEYSRYFVDLRWQREFAEGLLDLERNWEGPLQHNQRVFQTLQRFQRMEREAAPRDLLNWRFQQALYRAYYDAYVKARLDYETELENDAMEVLRTADRIGSWRAMQEVERILGGAVTQRVKPEWRARVFELAEALFQSVRMQLSVPKYQATQVGRGANLDMIDLPLNHRRQIEEMFAQIRNLDSETERLARLADIAAGRYERVEYEWEKILDRQFREAQK